MRTRAGLLFALAALIAGCGGSSGGGAPAAPGPLVANPGANQTVGELAGVTLSGSASTGPIQSYQWQQVSGLAVTLSNPNTANATFTAPDVTAPEDLVFRLTVADSAGATASALVTVTVVENPTISGRVTFDYVPVSGTPGVFLDYLNTEARPARGVTVQLIEGASTVLDTAVTDTNGDYSLTGAGSADVFVRARAEIVQSAPGWDVRVVDNTQGNAPYVMDGTPFNAAGTNVTVDLHAASGWTGAGYGDPRVAAPFAILDLVYDAMQLVRSADASADFPPLVMHWSPNNVDTFGPDGTPDTASGQIGTSFFRSGPGGGIFLLGEENDDTEEYDRHVIAHEWGHYLENNFSRSDSIGGPHTLDDRLDMRVAFGEGFGNAISGMITGDSVYKDTGGPQQSFGFSFNLENASVNAPGWYNEFSIQEILFDVFDPVDPNDPSDPANGDPVELGFGPIFDVLVGDQRDTVALTSLFPFISALKADLPGSAAAIDTLVSAQSIATITDELGTGRTNPLPPDDADVLPIYTNLMVGGPAANLCSTDDFNGGPPPGGTGGVNKLGSRRYLRFTAGTAGNYTFTATTTEVPAGAPADATPDPDMWLHRAGLIAIFEAAPDASCTVATLGNCREVAATAAYPQFFPGGILPAGEYVLEVYEWTNTVDDPMNPPLGRTCFDVQVTSP